MSVTDRIAAGIAELRERQLERSWAIVGALFAAVALVFVLFFSAAALFPVRFPGSVLVAFTATGAVAGAASLTRYGVGRRPVEHCMWLVGLWLGSLTASGFVLIEPELVLFAVVPITSATVILKQEMILTRVLFVVLPLMALCISITMGPVGWSAFR